MSDVSDDIHTKRCVITNPFRIASIYNHSTGQPISAEDLDKLKGTHRTYIVVALDDDENLLYKGEEIKAPTLTILEDYHNFEF